MEDKITIIVVKGSHNILAEFQPACALGKVTANKLIATI